MHIAMQNIDIFNFAQTLHCALDCYKNVPCILVKTICHPCNKPFTKWNKPWNLSLLDMKLFILTELSFSSWELTRLLQWVLLLNMCNLSNNVVSFWILNIYPMKSFRIQLFCICLEWNSFVFGCLLEYFKFSDEEEFVFSSLVLIFYCRVHTGNDPAYSQRCGQGAVHITVQSHAG